MPIFLICVAMFLFLLVIVTIFWGVTVMFSLDEIMAGAMLMLANFGLAAAWIYILIHYVIPRF